MTAFETKTVGPLTSTPVRVIDADDQVCSVRLSNAGSATGPYYIGYTNNLSTTIIMNGQPYPSNGFRSDVGINPFGPKFMLPAGVELWAYFNDGLYSGEIGITVIIEEV